MSGSIKPKTPEQVEAMAASGRVLAGALDEIEAEVCPGVTTGELDAIAESFIRDHSGIPSFLGVPAADPGVEPFPGAICASINDAIVHGIPGSAVLREGDIISLDCGVILDGWHSDSARTLAVGEIDPDASRLLDVTRAALAEAIRASVAGGHIGDIGAAVQKLVEEAGLTIVRRFVGHGIGRTMHESPQVPNFGRPGSGPELVPGTTLAIEPMVNIGSAGVAFDSDGWTARTDDGSLSAHFEHTVAITNAGPRVLTEAV
ncbi:MAG: type I methionyl aminopeptidase [Rhodospirillaceae bacterium]|nr:type I methionyl aminopeptidase [Rhodospirillaceae bacterium]